ncbi:MAG: hypothetical protein ACXWCY_29905 [Burkholderiales bacterium]
MLGATNHSYLYAGVPRLGVPSIAATRFRAAVVKHSDVILRIAVMCGGFVGYALSSLGR